MLQLDAGSAERAARPHTRRQSNPEPLVDALDMEAMPAIERYELVCVLVHLQADGAHVRLIRATQGNDETIQLCRAASLRVALLNFLCGFRRPPYEERPDLPLRHVLLISVLESHFV